jgi:Lar family restriction alleviation protein
MSELKPCPFCGSIDIEKSVYEYCVYCNDCQAASNTDSSDIVDAINKWNTRTQPDYEALARELETEAHEMDDSKYDYDLGIKKGLQIAAELLRRKAVTNDGQ